MNKTQRLNEIENSQKGAGPAFFHTLVNQRGLNRWSNNSEQKLGFLSKVKV